MRKALLLAAAVLALAGLAITAGQATMASASSERALGSLTGAGATFPFPLISKWIPAVDQALGINITYSPTGSGAGIAGITSRTVDFGASDAPLSGDQMRACNGCVVIPWALAGTSIPYNIPGIGQRLRLTGPVLAQIYLGAITNWNAPAIRALNPGRNLPDLRITPVYRSDSSGTTYNFTEYLSSVSGSWKSRVGNNTAVNFPAGTGARGSSGVAGVVRSTPGALTYVDAAYSITNKFTIAAIRNSAGTFTLPGLRNVTAAVSRLPAKVTNLSQLKIVNPPKAAGRQAYPISTFTYVIVATSSGAEAADLRKFIYWAVTAGQSFSQPLLFVKLPRPVQAFAFREIKKIQQGG